MEDFFEQELVGEGFEVDIYDDEGIDELYDEDGISNSQAGFMYGYLGG